MKKPEMIEKFGIPVTYLNPSNLEPSNTRSKIGGNEAYVIDKIDKCPYCKKKMTLIIELFKEEFKEAFFLEDSDYLQVKTCYNAECSFDENRDIEFKLGFGQISNLKSNTEIIESHIPEIYFEPKQNAEIPFNTYESSEQLKMRDEIGQEKYEEMIGEYTARIGTKLNGDVFAWQEVEIPICSCGSKMNQILQISSYEPCLHPNENRPYWNWESSIGIYIARIGNYHYFTCKSCNNGKIEYRWDAI